MECLEEDEAAEDLAPITRGEMRALIKKIESCVMWSSGTYDPPDGETAINTVLEGLVEDLKAVLGDS